MTIQKIIESKGSHAPFVAPETKISDVISGLVAKDIGALVVSSDGATIEGIISERDVVQGLQRFGADTLNHCVKDLMTVDVVTCKLKDPVAGVMALMDDRRIRHVPVVDKGKLAGIISIRDIVKLRLDEVQADAAAMHRYISGLS